MIHFLFATTETCCVAYLYRAKSSLLSQILNGTFFLLVSVSLQGNLLKILIVLTLVLMQKHPLSHPLCVRSRVHSPKAIYRYAKVHILQREGGVNRPHNRHWFTYRDFLGIGFYWPLDQILFPSQFKRNKWSG